VDRSLARIDVADLLRLASLAADAEAELFERNPRGSGRYSGRLLGRALCQGAALRCKGIRSSRAVEMATFDDVGARVICANLHPDHATVARFVTRHEGPLKGLLVASLAACAAQGLVSVDVVAGDGTKVKANASMAAGATAGQLELEITELEALLDAEVDGWFAQAQAADAAEDALFGEGEDDGGAGPGAGGGAMTLARLTGKIVRRQKAKARLDAEAAGRQAEATAAHQDKIARLQARAAARRADAERLAAETDARVADYQRRAAAKAAAGSRKRPDGGCRCPRTVTSWSAAPGGHSPPRSRRWPPPRPPRPPPHRQPSRPRPALPTRPAGSCPPRRADSTNCATSRYWRANTRSSTPSPPMATPPAPAPCTRCSPRPGPTSALPGSASRSARPCSTPGTPAQRRSPSRLRHARRTEWDSGAPTDAHTYDRRGSRRSVMHASERVPRWT